MTNEELVEQIQQGIDVQKNLGVLYEQNKNFLYYMIKPFTKYVETEDLMQEAYIGFHEAAMSYKSDGYDAKFTTYAAWKIRQKCVRYIQGNDTKKVSTNMKHTIYLYNKFVNQYVAEFGEEPDDSWVCNKLKTTQDRLDVIKKTIYEQNCISIHDTIPGNDDISIEDSIADPYNLEEDVEERQYQEYKKKVVQESIDTLPSREAEIIRGTFFEGLKQKDLARKLKLSTARIGQLERMALSRLRILDNLQKMREEEYGYDSSLAYRVSRQYCLDKRTSPTEILAMKRLQYEEEKMKPLKKSIDEIFAELMER